jgi:hypothetical protein
MVVLSVLLHETFTFILHHIAMSATPFNLIDRLKASGIHLAISLAIAALAAALVFLVWYPYPYSEISGGRELFILVVTIDVILGPLITFAVFNRAKPLRSLKRDLAVVGLIQLAALGYGLWTVFVARPVHLVFEYNRFRVVHAIEIEVDQLPKALPGLQKLPIGGVELLGLREFKDNREMADATLAAFVGEQLSAQPKLWQPYADSAAQIKREAKPVAILKTKFPSQLAQIDAAIVSSGKNTDQLAWLPMVGRKSFWTVLIDAQSTLPLAYLPLDSF